ncbi:Hypothetical predicted protein, partial [Olea europaea subsp. europaea]
ADCHLAAESRDTVLYSRTMTFKIGNGKRRSGGAATLFSRPEENRCRRRFSY